MPSRARKEERLSDNIKKAIRRAINQWEETHHTRCPNDIKAMFKAEFFKSVKQVDKQLHEVWNG